MISFPIHSLDTAPAGAQALLQQAQAQFGLIPNLFGGMASAPGLLKSYLAVYEAFSGGTLTALEQQVVCIAVSREHACHYCVAAHSTVAGMHGLDPAIIEALRLGTPLPAAKLEALRQFTVQMVRQRGWAEPGQLAALLAAGYSRETALEVITGIALKVMSNYTNHLIDTPVDAAFAPALMALPRTAPALAEAA
jgi:uncharacterized peroxidase-related enzyme